MCCRQVAQATMQANRGQMQINPHLKLHPFSELGEVRFNPDKEAITKKRILSELSQSSGTRDLLTTSRQKRSENCSMVAAQIGSATLTGPGVFGIKVHGPLLQLAVSENEN